MCLFWEKIKLLDWHGKIGVMDTASQSLATILQGDGYECLPNMPVFDEHDEGDAARNFDRKKLEVIAKVCNQRARSSGDLSPFGPGHTVDDVWEFDNKGKRVRLLYKARELDQPPIWGFFTNYRVGRFGPDNKLGILADAYVKKQIKTPEGVISGREAFSQFPRRSIELWLKDNFIDWIALLRRTPQRDLGLTVFSRVSLAGKYRYEKGIDVDSDLDNDGKPDNNPVADPDKDAPPPDDDNGDGVDDEFHGNFMKSINKEYPHLPKMHEEAAQKYGSASASATNGTLPGGPPPDDPGRLHMGRVGENRRYAALEQRLAVAEKKADSAEKELATQKQVAFRARAYARVQGIKRDGYKGDDEKLLKQFTRSPESEWDEVEDYIRDTHQVDPASTSLSYVKVAEDTIQGGKDKGDAPANDAEKEKVFDRMRKTNEDWNTALKYVRTGGRQNGKAV
jgi:hypothetical protein